MGADARKPDDFDWVTARRACFASVVLSDLLSQARRDAALVAAKNESPFVIHERPTWFNIVDARDERASFAKISIHKTGFRGTCMVRGQEVIDLAVTLKLGENGECRLADGSRLLQRWQFLQEVLEPLFFQADES